MLHCKKNLILSQVVKRKDKIYVYDEPNRTQLYAVATQDMFSMRFKCKNYSKIGPILNFDFKINAKTTLFQFYRNQKQIKKKYK